MKASHTRGAVRARFDDPSLVSCAGLVPVMRLAQDAGLHTLAEQHMKVPGPAGANAAAKIGSIVAGMAAGADSIDDLDLLRHGGMPRLFTGVRAPSTLGTFLRGLCHGDVRSVHAIHTRFLRNLAERTPLLPGADALVFLDIDAKKKEVHGQRREGARLAYTGIVGLDYLAVTMTGPLFAPVILTARLRNGAAHSCRGAAGMITEAIGLARRCGATGMIVVRADSGFYTADVITAIRAAGARFSITARDNNKAITTAISDIPDDAWQPITYNRPVFDADSDTWVHTAEVAQTGFTAFTNITEHPGGPVAAGLVVRRIPDTRHNKNNSSKNSGDSADSGGGQQELFTAWRYQAIFTDAGFDAADTERHHRGRARIEQVFADLNNSAAAHLPSGKFAASAAWLILACLTHNLLRATGCLASRFHARATTGTIRRHLVQVAARITRTARTLTLRLPQHWPWADTWQGLFTATHAPPQPT
jgi:hypothetical protein